MDTHSVTYYKLSFKVQHDCPYTNFTKDLPSSIISHWCNWSRDVIEIRLREQLNLETKKMIEDLLQTMGSTVIRRTSGAKNTQVILQHCSCDELPPPTLQFIETYECLEMQPKIYAGGWEHYQILSFSTKDLNALILELQKKSLVKIISKTVVSEDAIHDALLIPTSTIIGGLTEKQARSMLIAFENGYYEIPRRSTAEDVSSRSHLARTSFTDHLRKAELKIITAIVPYLKMKTSGTMSDNDTVT